MDKSRNEKIVEALKTRGVTRPCPRCGHLHFDFVAETLMTIQNDPNVFGVGGQVVPLAIVACSNCGYLSEHALGVLGLMPEVADAK